VGFDRQGGNGDAQQVPLVMALLEAGFADKLLFSADASRGYGKTLTVFVPKLKAAGRPTTCCTDHGGQLAPLSGLRAEAAAQADIGDRDEETGKHCWPSQRPRCCWRRRRGPR
jgi:hypothetical protein